MKNLPQKRREAAKPTFHSSPSAGEVRPREQKHTYLKVGDRVLHTNYRSWGGGIVLETWASHLPGGFCFVRILFRDGKQRVFDNSFESPACCYYSGITLLGRTEL